MKAKKEEKKVAEFTFKSKSMSTLSENEKRLD